MVLLGLFSFSIDIHNFEHLFVSLLSILIELVLRVIPNIIEATKIVRRTMELSILTFIHCLERVLVLLPCGNQFGVIQINITLNHIVELLDAMRMF